MTLVGPGGIGKTRLAVEAVQQVNFAHGVYFIPLQPLQSPNQVAGTIINLLNLRPDAGLEQRQVLLEYFRDRNLLLIFDNFEHVLDAADLLADILSAAPQVKLLVTSRESLRLQEEWVRVIHGLSYPDGTDASAMEHYSAVQLFIERARELRLIKP